MSDSHIEREHSSRVWPKGEKNGQAKLNENKVLEIRKRASEGENLRKLSEEFGVTYVSIAAVVSHRRWKHLTENTPENIIALVPTEKNLAEMRPIKGYEGKYSITPEGSVISNERVVKRVLNGKTVNAIIQKRILKHGLNPNGYPMVGLKKNGISETKTIHTLVADAFLPPPTEGQTQVRHKDGNKEIPHVDNLERGTAKENAADKDRHGTTSRGERIGTSKLTENEVLEIRARIVDGVKKSSLAIEYGVSAVTVRMIANRTRWNHIP